MKYIGIFGGSFDPIHNGHIRALNAFIRIHDFERVFIVPTGNPPHKKRSTPANQRIDMLKLAIGDTAEISEIEAYSNETSYTYNTVRTLMDLYPECRPVIYVGSDMFLLIKQWYRSDELMKIADFAVFSRNGKDSEQLLEFGKNLDANWQLYDDYEPIEMSSAEIRRSVSEGKDISGMVPAAVAEYIRENMLYKDIAMFDEERAMFILKGRLSEERLAHSLGVMKQAVLLAEKHGWDTNKAKIAGLLHDCTKSYTYSTNIQVMKQHGVWTEMDSMYPKILHAITAPFSAKEDFGVTDEDILSAIRWHTTGKADMTLGEKIIYMADITDETRSYSDVEYYRNLSFEDLDRSVLEATAWIIGDKLNSLASIHPATLENYNYLIQNRKKGEIK